LLFQWFVILLKRAGLGLVTGGTGLRAGQESIRTVRPAAGAVS
jgi:hypothetical protein